MYYAPNIRRNYLSALALTERDNKVVMSENTFEIFNNKGERIIKSDKVNRLYLLKCIVILKNEECNFVNLSITQKERWHRILAYVNFKDLQIMAKNKITKIMFDNCRKRATYPGQIIRTNVKFMDVESYKKDKYFVTFIEDLFAFSSSIYN